MGKRVRGLTALLMVVPVAVAGCSSSSNGKANGSSAPATTPAATTATTPSAPASSSSSEAITQAQATAALLTAADVGTTFTSAQFKPSTDALPCTPNDPPLEQQVPSTLQVGSAVIAKSNQAALSEDLRFYPDVATAQQVLSLAAKGLDCASGKLNITGTPETVTFGKQQDVTAAVGADQAVAVPAAAANYSIVLIGCRIGRALVLFSFLRTKTSSTSVLPNPITIAAKGVTKIKSS